MTHIKHRQQSMSRCSALSRAVWEGGDMYCAWAKIAIAVLCDGTNTLQHLPVREYTLQHLPVRE